MQAAAPSLLGPKKELHSVEGRVALVTGGSQGIGFNVARGLLEAKAKKVILVSYDDERGSEAVQKLKDEFGSHVDVEWHHCNMGSLKAVLDTFTKIREAQERLDLLVLSAGINAAPFGLDADGIDRHFGVNWLGQFYAINLLYPLMRKTANQPGAASGRIVVESSELHRASPSSVSFNSIDDINNRELGPTQLYARSKLCMILGMKFGLYERVIKPNGDNIYAIAVHPGAVMTNMQNHWKEAYDDIRGEIAFDLSMLFGRSPEQGSYSTLYAATSPDIEKNQWNGVYLNDTASLGKENKLANNPELGASLWSLSESLVKEKLGNDALAEWHRSE